MSAGDPHGTVSAIFRAESPKLIASLTRLVRDVGVAEELAQDALVAALEAWPRTGIPDKPGAWLMTTARRRAINVVRRQQMTERKHDELAWLLDTTRPSTPSSIEASADDDIGDDLLRLVFVACHPVLSIEARVALTLRLLGGLQTDEIARAFLLPQATIAQRIVRAKRTLADRQVPFEIPRAEELGVRLSAVFGVVYLIFNEGYTATSGPELMRPSLCEDALRLARLLATLVADEPEAHGLLALMELHGSRSASRVGPDGEPILLLDQDRSRWDPGSIERGLAALARAESLAETRGPYLLQAAIAACHARARTAAETDWARIAGLYGELAAIQPSPVIELNRAVAIGMAEGPAAGLAVLDSLANDRALERYHLLPSARADMLEKLGRYPEARAEFERAATMTRNEREQRLLRARAAACIGH